jgi:hypothetical protein
VANPNQIAPNQIAKALQEVRGSEKVAQDCVRKRERVAAHLHHAKPDQTLAWRGTGPNHLEKDEIPPLDEEQEQQGCATGDSPTHPKMSPGRQEHDDLHCRKSQEPNQPIHHVGQRAARGPGHVEAEAHVIWGFYSDGVVELHGGSFLGSVRSEHGAIAASSSATKLVIRMTCSKENSSLTNDALADPCSERRKLCPCRS